MNTSLKDFNIYVAEILRLKVPMGTSLGYTIPKVPKTVDMHLLPKVA